MNWNKTDRPSSEKNKQYRIIYARTLRDLGVALLISALLSSLADRSVASIHFYFVSATCAVGAVFLCWAWFTYLKRLGYFGSFPQKKQKKQTPYMLRREKPSHPHRPAFARDNRDFDDDLVAATSVDEEPFSEKERMGFKIRSRAYCGMGMVALSVLLQVVTIA